MIIFYMMEEKILKRQIKYCSKINCKQRTIMPQKGKFENYMLNSKTKRKNL